MVKNPQYKRILLACSLVLVSFVILNAIPLQKSISFDVAEIPDNYMVIEGFVVSKQFNSIWLAEEPISFKGVVLGSIKGYGVDSIKVSKNKDYEYIINFGQLKLNQKVRVYCDYVRESNPPKSAAFYVELVENSD
ncbi:DUF3221 domain-containing protein [Sporosarcina sp. Te-1]|uniref:DUF3221 domain-containing protein n=1 Tax=Sporosarcina sp. Te-1 TaxID=2818390 RepID=UPI001A9D1A8E|nr:DUF3221 domain-containing protein [Sporosarcina sp. Te-1]QTD41533.1 DUF3221 domain-containing protein [Sporosarcina sp. Te-1]